MNRRSFLKGSIASLIAVALPAPALDLSATPIDKSRITDDYAIANNDIDSLMPPPYFIVSTVVERDALALYEDALVDVIGSSGDKSSLYYYTHSDKKFTLIKML